ncbi:MAG: urease accessory protein UreD [Polaromonas sp.]|nr:urease accessory protein UreD [Polaromonas sp.]
MAWHAKLDVDYRMEAGRCVVHHAHTGPLRILQSLYPEGEHICHNVIVHPPGGLVGGDTLDLKFSAACGTHGLVTTPGATRFYRSDGAPALQRSVLTLAAGARMEWLPLEAIAFNGCLAENRLTMNLAPGAELLGWDVTAFGLPAADKPFDTGHFLQHIEVPGVWLERAHIRAADTLLMNSPLGMAGQRCMATLFFVAGSKLERKRRQAALDMAREIIDAHPLFSSAGATSPDGQLVVVRVLAPVVEPAMSLLKHVRRVWRSQLWQVAADNPRIWST